MGSRLTCRRALYVPAPRSGDHEETVQALEAKSAQEGQVLTEAQIIALGRGALEADAVE